jgi:Ca-activated chloride channel homolog
VKIRHLIWVALTAMTASSATVYAVTPAGAWTSTAAQQQVGQATSAMAGPVVTPRSRWDGTVTVDARLGHASLRSGGNTYLMVGVRGASRTPARRVPVAVALVLDRSGSMAGARLDRALEAARGVVERLRDGDVVTAVAFDTGTQLIVPPTELGPASRASVAAALRRVGPGGDTCVSCGIEAALGELARLGDRPRHMIVLSDGKTNHGLRDTTALAALAETCRRGGVSISTVGVGADYDAQLLAGIARAGEGRHHFADTAASLPALFDAEAAALTATVAAGARAEITLADGVELVRVLDRAHDEGERITVPLGTFAEDEEKTVLLELRTADGEPAATNVATVRIVFDDLVERRNAVVESTLGLTATGPDGADSAIDAAVLERLERSRTSTALDEVNDLLGKGRVAEASARVEARELAIEEARTSGGSATAAGYDRQLAITSRARGDLTKARGRRGGACGCSGDDLMCHMRCSNNANVADAYDMER